METFECKVCLKIAHGNEFMLRKTCEACRNIALFNQYMKLKQETYFSSLDSEVDIKRFLSKKILKLKSSKKGRVISKEELLSTSEESENQDSDKDPEFVPSTPQAAKLKTKKSRLEGSSSITQISGSVPTTLTKVIEKPNSPFSTPIKVNPTTISHVPKKNIFKKSKVTVPLQKQSVVCEKNLDNIVDDIPYLNDLARDRLIFEESHSGDVNYFPGVAVKCNFSDSLDPDKYLASVRFLEYRKTMIERDLKSFFGDIYKVSFFANTYFIVWQFSNNFFFM
ncbi:uncharacterized protein LOC136093452 [Hydra vulgaris]|uniref:uncharacterized protein LOC136093224 n=1 Tax=Hydra vulgaris TaxID=6087 RepID=UPI0032EA1EBE